MQKIYPFGVAKEVGRGAAGLAADDLLDLAQRSREGGAIQKHFSRKQNVCGNSEAESIAIVKYRRLLPVPSTPLHTYPQRTFPQIAREGQFNSFCDE